MQPTLAKGTPAGRRYFIRTAAFMGAYVVINIAIMSGAVDPLIGTPGAWGLALLVSVLVMGQIWATLSLIRESDEFIRAVTAKLFIVSAGAAMAIATAWGFGESYAGAPHLPAWLIYPLFWACWGAASIFIRGSK